MGLFNRHLQYVGTELKSTLVELDKYTYAKLHTVYIGSPREVSIAYDTDVMSHDQALEKAKNAMKEELIEAIKLYERVLVLVSL